MNKKTGKTPGSPRTRGRKGIRRSGPTSQQAAPSPEAPSGLKQLPIVGAQISTAGGFAPVPERAAALGAEVVQIFSSNPRTWRTRHPEPDEMAALKTGLRRYRLPLFFHTIYLINLASPDGELRARSAAALAHALVTGALAGAAGVVTHVGSHRGEGFEASIGLVAEAIRSAETTARETLAAEQTGQSEPALPPLLLETAVGAGAIVGRNIGELRALLEALALRPPARAVSRDRSTRPAPPSASSLTPGWPLDLGLCLDTAHLFAAGYPIHEETGLQVLLDELDRAGLLSRVGLIHLNDSASELASNRDRHANPGDGLIGYEGLARIVRHPALTRIPFVLEVPGAEGHGPDADNVALVKLMRAGLPRPAEAPSRPESPGHGG